MFKLNWLVMVIAIFFLTVSLSSASTQTTSGEIKSYHVWAENIARDVVENIKKTHPRIFLTKERIPGVIKDASFSKKRIFKLMQARMKGPQAALFYALGGRKELGLSGMSEEYGRIAANELIKSLRSGNKRTSVDDLAVMYDWAYGALTPAEREEFVAFCRRKLGNRIHIHNGKQHGYRCSPEPKGIIAALAFYGDGIDDDYAKKLLIQGIRDTLLDNLAMEHVAGNEGGFADGTGYIYQLGGTFMPFLAISTATDSDFFFQHEVIVKMPRYLLYSLLPCSISIAGKNKRERYFVNFNDHSTGTTTIKSSRGNLLVWKYIVTAAEYYRKGDDRKAGIIRKLLKEGFAIDKVPWIGSSALWFVLMSWPDTDQNHGKVHLPLAEAFGWDEKNGEINRDRFGKKAGIGWVCMRSAWDDPDATFAILKAEPFHYHGHQHYDSLAFMIAKGEELALARAGNYMCWFEGDQVGSRNPGWPQMFNFFAQTVSTSNLLVYDPSERFKLWGEEWANNGGQRMKNYWHQRWGRSYPGTANGNYRDIGGIIHFERNEKFVYTVADATRAYNSTLVTSNGNKPKVSLVQREFVYLRSPGGEKDFFVIFDRVAPVKPDLKSFWLLQLRAKPYFNGGHRVVLGDENGGIHISEDTSEINVKQDRAQLFCKSLLPRDGNRIVRRLGGWITTILEEPLEANDNGPRDIKVESTKGLPDHPVVIITNDPQNPEKEVFDRYSVWPQVRRASTKVSGKRICYFCGGKTPPGRRPAKLLNCIRAIKSAPGFAMPVGSEVRQEFRHMGIQGADKMKDAERIDYPWGYGLGYNYGDGNQYGMWRIEVSPKRPSRLVNFLHVLHPTLKGDGLPDTQLIESKSANLCGTRIGDRVVVFAKASESMIEGAYTIELAGPAWQLLCDLRPEKDYEIRQNGKEILTARTSKQGILEFESPIKGIAKFEFKIKNQQK